MRKKTLTLLTVLLSMGLYAQVGINTQNPKASLDIVANTTSPTASGLLVPRLTAKEVKKMTDATAPRLVGDDQNALLVYVTATFTASPTDTRYTDIDAIGYYYWDAKDNTPNGKWKKLGSTPYTAGAGIQIEGNVVSATGLERTDSGSYYAWHLIGREKNFMGTAPKYATLGEGAVDLSYGNTVIIGTTQTPTGASGAFSLATGQATIASGTHAIAMGYYSNALGTHSIAIGGKAAPVPGYIETAQALGNGSIAIGSLVKATAPSSLSLGWGDFLASKPTQATSDYAVAIGYSTTASGKGSTAMGSYTTAKGNYSVAMGGEVDNTKANRPAKALGTNSLAFGRWTEAQADHSMALGWGDSATDLTKAQSEYAVAIGYATIASGTAATTMGYGTTASGTVSIAMGNITKALGHSSTAMGRLTTASGDVSTAMGLGTEASESYSTAMGAYNATPTNALLMVGNGNENGGSPIYQNALTVYKDGTIEAKAIAETDGSTATKVVVVNPEGKLKSIDKSSFIYTAGAGINISSNKEISATGLERITEDGNTGWRLVGRNSNNYGNIGDGAVDLSYSYTASNTLGATGDHSIAMGWKTTASGSSSVAMGWKTTASGSSSVAMGSSTIASGVISTAMGLRTRALGQYSTAMGVETTASGKYSTAMGERTTASGESSTAMGERTTASGRHSTAMGFGTTASGTTSTAMGRETTASAEISTAMGYQTTASGNYSTAMGVETTASGYTSIAMGYRTTASGTTSTAMGYQTTASLQYSTAMGWKANTGSNLILVVGNGENIFGVDKNGGVYAKGSFYPFAISTVSDGRLKKDVVPLSSASATLAKLRPVQYHWNAEAKAQSNENKRLQYGFIAQEVEEVLPFLVDEHPTLSDENKMIKSLNYTGIIPILTKALQEKSAEIEALKAELQAEKARNDQQEAQLQSQEARLKAIEAKLK